jgi:hypothetical protein
LTRETISRVVFVHENYLIVICELDSENMGFWANNVCGNTYHFSNKLVCYIIFGDILDLHFASRELGNKMWRDVAR